MSEEKKQDEDLLVDPIEMPDCAVRGTFRLRERGFARPVPFDAETRRLAENYAKKFPDTEDLIKSR